MTGSALRAGWFSDALPPSQREGPVPMTDDRQRVQRDAWGLLEAVRGLAPLTEARRIILLLIFVRWTLAKDGGRVWRAIVSEAETENFSALLGISQADDEFRQLWRNELVHGRKDVADLTRAIVLQLDRISGSDLTAYLPLLFDEVADQSAKAEGRLAGEWTTPNSVRRLISKVTDFSGGAIYDPAVGFGGLLLDLAKAAAESGHDVAGLYGQDVNADAILLSRLHMRIRGYEPQLHDGDSIAEDFFLGLRAGAVVCDPPFGLHLRTPLEPDDERWQFGVPSKSSADFAWLQHCLYHLDDHGTACIVLSHGSLFRGGRENHIRRQLLDRGLVEAVISLPPRLFNETTIPGALWIMRKGRTDQLQGRVLLLNASALGEFVKERRSGNVEFSKDEIAAVSDTVSAWRDGLSDVGPLGRVVTTDEMDLNGGTVMDPRRFVDPPEPKAPVLEQSPNRLLTRLRVGNVKAFSSLQNVELAPLTLIFGPNSAGKSTLIQSLLLLKQSLATATAVGAASAAAPRLVTHGEVADLGSFLGLIHNHDRSSSLTLGVSFGGPDSYRPQNGYASKRLVRHVDLRFGLGIETRLAKSRPLSGSAIPFRFTSTRPPPRQSSSMGIEMPQSVSNSPPMKRPA